MSHKERVVINSEVYVCEEQGAVHIRAASFGTDPAELSVDQADRLVSALQQIIAKIRYDDDHPTSA